MTYDEAMAWMRAHGATVEAQSQAYDGWARTVSYRYTEVLMAPHSGRAQQRLVEAVTRYLQAQPLAGLRWKSLSQQALDDITREEDRRALTEIEATCPTQGDHE